MHRSEELDSVICSDCQAELEPDTQRGYQVDETRFLCFDCALHRGGEFDELHDRWTRAPSVDAGRAPG